MNAMLDNSLDRFDDVNFRYRVWYEKGNGFEAVMESTSRVTVKTVYAGNNVTKCEVIGSIHREGGAVIAVLDHNGKEVWHA